MLSHTVRALEPNVVRLKIVIFGRLDSTSDGFRFACVALLDMMK
jgi:hypothetical protein